MTMKRLQVVLVFGLICSCSDSEELVNRPGDDAGTSETGGGGADASADASTDPVAEADVAADPCAERDDLWTQMVELLPQYEEYQSRTTRQIPIVVLEPQH